MYIHNREDSEQIFEQYWKIYRSRCVFWIAIANSNSNLKSRSVFIAASIFLLHFHCESIELPYIFQCYFFEKYWEILLTKLKDNNKLLEFFSNFLRIRFISLPAMKIRFFDVKIFFRWRVFARNWTRWKKWQPWISFYRSSFHDRGGRSRVSGACVRESKGGETWRVSESIRMPTILRPRIIHQPDRSQTNKKLANSSKPIATRRTLTVLYTFGRFR